LKKFPIKIVYNFEDSEYMVFVDGIKGLEGYGSTEEEAIADFYNMMEKEMGNE
jgi:predicted RNase H-like HicB family nuclease